MKKYLIISLICASIFNFGRAQQTFSFDFSSLKSDTIDVGGDKFLLLSDKTLPYQTEISGRPLIPCFNQLITLPLSDKVSVEYRVSDAESVELTNGLRLYPKQPDLMKNELPQDFVLDHQYYDFGVGNDTAAVRIIDLGVSKNKRVLLLQVLPAAYLPLENVLIRYGAVNVEIVVESSDVVEKSLATNAKPRKMIVVSPEMFRQNLQPFVQWKKQEGINVMEVYPDDVSGGWTANSIRQHLQTLWDNQTESEPFADFLLLCGDVAQLPAFNGTTDTHVTDLYYADYTADGIPDVLYGRFSAQTSAQMNAIVEKTVAYEKFELSDTSYLNDVLLVAGQETANYAILDANGQLNYAKMYLSNLDTAIYYNVLPNDSLLSGANNFNAILARLNAGNSFVNYTAHCSSSGWYDPSISSSNINSMPQNDKVGFYINNCCVSGKFDESQCFAEALLRAPNKGAIGVISASNNTYWAGDWIFAVGNQAEVFYPPYDSLSLGMYDRMFHTHGELREEYAMTQAEIMQAGNLSVTLAQKSYALYYREIYHLFGDPSLIPYIGMPQRQNVDLPALLPTGTSDFSTTVAPYSYVALSIGDSLLAAHRADSAGYVNFTFDPIAADCYLRVVVTNLSYCPLIDSIPIQTLNEPYLALTNLTFLNEANQQTTEFLADSSYSLSFDLQNYGLQTANNVRLLLHANDGFTPLEGEYNAGNINYQQTIAMNDVLKFKLNSALPNNYMVKMPVEIFATNFHAYDTLNINISSPDLDIKNLVVAATNDNPYISFEVINKGKATSVEGNVRISNLNQIATLIDADTQPLNTLLPNQSQHFTFQIALSPQANDTSALSFKLAATAYPYQITKNFSDILLGGNIEDFETKDFSRYPWQQVNKAWIIDTVTKYQGSASARSGHITNDQISSLKLSATAIGADSISFFVKVSTEASYDKLHFYIDNVEKLVLDGEHNWQRYSFAVSEGVHNYQWSYVKDYSVNGGSDAVWIDNVKIPTMASVSSLQNVESANRIKMYPNPAFDKLTLDNVSPKSSIVIIDLLGKVHYSRFETNEGAITIDLSQIPKGQYMVCIRSADNLTTQKLIIAR
ncbi:MAG: C25 family cysteine peptidase [Bacteroidales bacterium]|jgi:hypothetical protein|nr:C25 family cysteine peptidase [Bacteroidales bacterium]